MESAKAPPSHRAPEPPRRFRGAFLTDAAALDHMARASGPFRLRPSAVAVPGDAEAAVELVLWARAEGVTLVPRGAGTGMPGGNVGRGVVVDLSELTEVTVIDEVEGRIRAGSGVRGDDLDAAARPLGRFFPAMPSSSDRCTVGGMVANNAAGARTFGYGAVHRWVERVEVVLPDGTLEHFSKGERSPRFDALRDALAARLPAVPPGWPAVRKNSSGYALDRFLPDADPVELLVGSEGTLGLVTRTELRTARAPVRRAVAILPVPTLKDIDGLVAQVQALGATVCEFFGRRFLDIAGLRNDPLVAPVVGGHDALLLLELAGDDDEVEDRLRQLQTLAAAAGVSLRIGLSSEDQARLWRVRHAASPVVAARADEGLVSMQFIEDSVVPPGQLAAYLHGLHEILTGEETDAVVFGHAGDANVHVNPLVDVRREGWRSRVDRILRGTVDLVARLGGTLSGEHGDGRLRAPFHEAIYGPVWTQAFRAVKAELDPEGLFNPGVIVAVPGQDPLDGLSARGRTA